MLWEVVRTTIAGDHACIGGESGVHGWKERAHIASPQPHHVPRRRGAGDLGDRFPDFRRTDGNIPTCAAQKEDVICEDPNSPENIFSKKEYRPL